MVCTVCPSSPKHPNTLQPEPPTCLGLGVHPNPDPSFLFLRPYSDPAPLFCDSPPPHFLPYSLDEVHHLVRPMQGGKVTCPPSASPTVPVHPSCPGTVKGWGPYNVHWGGTMYTEGGTMYTVGGTMYTEGGYNVH